MEKLVDLLKIIAEKYLVQTVASVALAILGVAFFPNLLDMTNKVGKTLYGVLIFCLGFLLIQGAKQIYTIAKNKVAEKNKKRLSDERRKRKADENEAEAIEQLWDYVDSLGLQDTIASLHKEVAELKSQLATTEGKLQDALSIEKAESLIDKTRGSIYYEHFNNGGSRPIRGFCWEKNRIKIP